ncbi:LemA family protein [Alkalimarinus alittae]|uniref:LemA family protein n=1 Tax=Alkalimarinus alittae TaxID=2961619 RepID=A0ABY6MZK7_9ALTE|nr:LemA family protein [Alkalimarinus alittae]UZE95281.1 LemA family protein [Alkalimarinus alittae]
MKKLLTTTPIFILITAALCFVSFMLLTKGFNEIEHIRQLERIPEISINTVLTGEVSIKGEVKPLAPLIDSPYTATPSVYYRFLHEEERVDSDGDSYWATLVDEAQTSDFSVSDTTGSIDVSTSENSLTPILWTMPSAMRKTLGKNRYTEWRIEPDQTVHVIAYAINEGDTTKLSFTPEGLYSPIVTQYSPMYEREQMGKNGIIFIWVGLVALAFSIFSIVWVLKIHSVIAYLSMLTIALTLVLVQLGISMLSNDIKASVTRLYAQYDAVQQALNDVNEPAPKRLSGLKVNLALYQAQLGHQLDRFPDNVVGWLIDADTNLKQLALNNTEKAQLTHRLSNIKKTTLSEPWVKWVPLMAFIIMFAGSYFGFRKIRFKRFIESIPTSKISGVVYGLAEIKGEIENLTETNILTTPVSAKQSVWYYYKKEEKRKSGKDDKWVILKEETKSVPFSAFDHTGKIKIIADNADVISKHKKVTREGRYRYTEQYLKPNETLYAIGSAKIDPNDHSRLLIGNGDKSEPFILSNYSEQHVMLHKARSGMILLNIAFSALLLGVLLLFASSGNISPDSFLMAALSAPILMMILMAILHYNDILFLRQRVERNIANINVILQKRFDLIPILEKTVKQYLAHEGSSLSQVSQLRSLYNPNNEQTGSHDQSLSTQIRLLIEKYPELKSHQMIKPLMDATITLEDELSVMRSGYLDAVEIYNSRICSFPDVMLAHVFGFKEHTVRSW